MKGTRTGAALATIGAMAMMNACAVKVPDHTVRPAQAAVQAPPAPRVVAPGLQGEVLGEPAERGVPPGAGARGEAVEQEPVAAEAVVPPEPQTILASIGPTTSPQRAASLRLTDEGRRLLEKGDYPAALDRIEKAVKIDPSNAHGYYWLAQVHDRGGRPDLGLAFADRSIVLFSQSDRTWLVQAYTFRATILERAGRFPEARDSYRHAVQLEPGNVAGRAGLARLGQPASLSAP